MSKQNIYKLDKVPAKDTMVILNMMYDLNLALILKSNYTVTLTFDLEDNISSA